MDSKLISVLLLQIGAGLLLLITALFIIRQYYAMKMEKRFEPFSLQSYHVEELSILDKLFLRLWKWIRLFTRVLEKSKVLVNYGKKYERFITFQEREKKSGVDYVSIKIFIGGIFVFLNCITVILKRSTIHFIPCLFVFLVGFFLPDLFLKISFLKKQKQVEEDLLKAILIMNNSFKSGRNIMQAIYAVKTELIGPIADEFEKIYLDITYGLSLEVVFNRFYERIKLEDAKYIASSLTLLNKTGGNIIQVFSTIEKSVFERKKLRNELKSLTAASVFVFRVLVFLPFIFILTIYCLNPTYFMPLFKNPIGILFLLLILLLFILYIFIIKKVLKVNIQ